MNQALYNTIRWY